MKYNFNPKLLNKIYLPRFIVCIALIVIFGALAVVSSTFKSFVLPGDIFSLLFMFSAFSFLVLLVIFYSRHRKFKDGYISIYKNNIKYRTHNMRNFWSEWNMYGEFKLYAITANRIDIRKNSIVLSGKIELAVCDDDDYTETTAERKRIAIPFCYDDMDKAAEKIKQLVKKMY